MTNKSSADQSREDDPHKALGRKFAEAAELLAEQPRRMVDSLREFAQQYERVSRKIEHGSRRTNGRIG